MEIVKQLVIDLSSKQQLVFVFGLSENDKNRIIFDAASAGVEFLPKDIEKDTGKKERSQFYETKLVFFHSPGILAKDFLTNMIDPKKIDGLIITNCETVHKDSGLQLCLARYKSLNPGGWIRAFTERVHDVADLKASANLLWVSYILMFPRFELNVRESLMTCQVQIIDISLKRENLPLEGDDKFVPIVSKNFSRVFELLSSLLSSFVSEYGRKLNVTVDDCLILQKRTLENRVGEDEAKQKVFDSLMFLRRALFVLLHEDPAIFHEYLRAHHPSQVNRPLWCSYPQVSPLYSATALLAEEAMPSPKLQWIIHLIQELPNYKRVLILAQGAGTTSMIANFLAGFTPRTDSTGIEVPMTEVENDEELLIDPTSFGIIEEPMVMVQEIHSQADVLERYQPDYVIFWDVSLLAMRRLEVYNSKYKKGVVAYLLSYTEAKESERMNHGIKLERDTFVKCIKALPTIDLQTKQPLPEPQRDIVVDDREFRSGLPLGLLQAGFRVLPALITVGDYVLSDDTVIERKAYADLVGSLRTGRLLAQIQRMQKYYPKSMLLIEFSDTGQFNSVSAKGGNPLVMIKIAMIMRFFPECRIVWARNNTEAAKTLMSLAEQTKAPDLGSAVAMGAHDKDSSKELSKPMQFLSAIPFLNQQSIEAITTNCKSLKELASMSRDELLRFLEPRIGVKLYSLLHSPLKQPST